jgi:beta-lactamase superfamily II metal-dependent hydrolase
MRRPFSMTRTILVLTVAVFAILTATAQKCSYLGLKSAGQAAYCIDRKDRVAYIRDFGGSADAREQIPHLLEKWDEAHVNKLVINCSHPHLDHMGGLIELASDRANFYTPDGLRFGNGIYVIDRDPKNTLPALLRRTLGSNEKVHHLPAGNRNAFSAVSAIDGDVFMMNIPYEVPSRTDSPSKRVTSHVHDSAVVTLTVLSRKCTILDLDDASTEAIKRVASELRKRSNIREFDAVIISHHGSKNNDNGPLLDAFQFRKVVFAVNEDNRFGHPDTTVVVQAIKKVGAGNVLFTGSDDAIEFDPTGVKFVYSATNAAGFRAFILPNLLRASSEDREFLRELDPTRDTQRPKFQIESQPNKDTKSELSTWAKTWEAVIEYARKLQDDMRDSIKEEGGPAKVVK